MKIPLTVQIEPEIIIYLLNSALEQGSRYWCHHAESASTETLPYVASFNEEFLQTWKDFPFYRKLLRKGAILKLQYDLASEPEGNAKGHINLNWDQLLEGLSKLSEDYPQIFGNIISDNYDCLDADAWLQCCIFGKIVYA